MTLEPFVRNLGKRRRAGGLLALDVYRVLAIQYHQPKFCRLGKSVIVGEGVGRAD